MSNLTPARRFFTAAGVAAVAAVAGLLSYRHQQSLAFAHGQPEALSIVWPLCVDGLVASTGIAIATDRAEGYRPRLWALTGFWLGVVVSVLTNWLATEGGLINHGVSAFPALAFLVAVESLSAKPRPRKAQAAADMAHRLNAPARMSHPTPTMADMPAMIPPVPATMTPEPATAAAPTAARVKAAAAANPGASAAAIAAAAGVSERTVYRYVKQGADTVPAPRVALAQVSA